MTPNEEEFLENLPKAADSYNDDSGQDDSLKEGNFNNPANKSNKNPKHDNFGRDRNEGKLDPVVEKEIERVCQTSRRKRTTLSYW
jgi:ATP-dependent Clp protease ATP-binding subunit ClpC